MTANRYTAFHRERMGPHLYPNEFLIRTMLGRYPRLTMSRDYKGRRLLDLGFGDGRNFPLFRNLGVEIYGVEPDPEMCRIVAERVGPEGIPCTLRPGCNTEIPFDNGFFDFIIASSSVYYVRDGETFSDNLREVVRVLRPGGWLVATLPDLDNALLAGAIPLGDGHWRITSDPFDLRNGSVFRAFESMSQIEAAFSPSFEELAIARFHDDWYGLVVSGFALVCRAKASA